VHGLTRSFYKKMQRNGVRIFEWGGAMMHAKTAVVDGRWTRVGSTDFNPLGIAINFELDAIIEDPKVGSRAEAMFEEDLSHSKEIRLRGRTPRARRPR
jgi:cardiolipin synthase